MQQFSTRAKFHSFPSHLLCPYQEIKRGIDLHRIFFFPATKVSDYTSIYREQNEKGKEYLSRSCNRQKSSCILKDQKSQSVTSALLPSHKCGSCKFMIHIAYRYEETVSSLALLAVTLQLVHSAERGNAPLHATHSSLGQAKELVTWCCKCLMLLWCASSSIAYFHLRKSAWFSAQDWQIAARFDMFVALNCFLKEHHLPQRHSFGLQVFFMHSPTSLAMALQLFKSFLLKTSHCPLYIIWGNQKAHQGFEFHSV